MAQWCYKAFYRHQSIWICQIFVPGNAAHKSPEASVVLYTQMFTGAFTGAARCVGWRGASSFISLSFGNLRAVEASTAPGDGASTACRFGTLFMENIFLALPSAAAAMADVWLCELRVRDSAGPICLRTHGDPASVYEQRCCYRALFVLYTMLRAQQSHAQTVRHPPINLTRSRRGWSPSS